MTEAHLGPGTMLEVIVAAIDAGAKYGDVLTLTDADGREQTVTLGERIVLPSQVEPFLLSDPTIESPRRLDESAGALRTLGRFIGCG